MGLPRLLRLAGHAPLVVVSVALAGCEPLAEAGHPFTSAAPAAAAATTSATDDFDFPSDPPLVLTSEQMAAGDLGAGLATAAGVDAGTLSGPIAGSITGVNTVLPAVEQPAARAEVSNAAANMPAAVQWPVRLLSTLPQAQPPRAVLGLPSGEERVVSPGSILAEQGLVVMTVTDGRVQLARIEAAGDHARIDTIELTAQYPR